MSKCVPSRGTCRPADVIGIAVSAGAVQPLGWRGWHHSPYGNPDNLSAGVLRRACQFRSAGRCRVPRRDDPEPGTSVLLPARLVGLAAAGGPARSELGLPRMGIPDSSVAGAAVPSRNRWRGNRAQRMSRGAGPLDLRQMRFQRSAFITLLGRRLRVPSYTQLPKISIWI